MDRICTYNTVRQCLSVTKGFNDTLKQTALTQKKHNKDAI